MLSISSYALLSTIATGDVTVHALYTGLSARLRHARDEVLLSALIELCDKKFVRWRYHPAYGDRPATKEMEGGPIAFLDAWQKLFGTAGPITAEPTPGTITVDITEAGKAELDDRVYEQFNKIIEAWERRQTVDGDLGAER